MKREQVLFRSSPARLETVLSTWSPKQLCRELSYDLISGAGCVHWAHMKFTLSFIVYILIGAVLGWGILLAVHGSYWLLIASFAFYVLAFARIGCMHH